MKFFQKCDICKKRKFITMRRDLIHKTVGKITSRDHACGKCYKTWKLALKDQLT